MKEETKEQTQNLTPFQKFESLAKRLFAVPKKEVDQKIQEFKLRQQKKRAAS